MENDRVAVITIACRCREMIAKNIRVSEVAKATVSVYVDPACIIHGRLSDDFKVDSNCVSKNDFIFDGDYGSHSSGLMEL